MDFNVHRFRFGDWVPSAIKSIACDRFSNRVALGREDGEIEICNSTAKWHVQCRISGITDFKLQELVWSTTSEVSGRLFGISLRGFVFEVDFDSLSIINIRDAYGGAAWCMAASLQHSSIAMGCEDGSVRLYSFDVGTPLEYQKALPSTGCRVLSVAYHPTEPRIYAGCADGTIRCMHETTGASLFRLLGDVQRGISTNIWSLLVLSDSTIVSGDSHGNVQLWDGVNAVRLASFHQHTAEIVALAVSEDEDQLFASGVDSRVTCMKRLGNAESDKGGESSEKSREWVYTSAHRPHSHDVYSLAVTTSNPPCLLSGGLDTKLCSYSLLEFARQRPVWILPIPAFGLFDHCNNYSVCALRHRSSIDIWGLSLIKCAGKAQKAQKKDKKGSVPVVDETSLTTVDTAANANTGCSKLLQLCIKGSDHIHCSAISPCGQYVAVSSRSGTRMWKINNTSCSQDGSMLKVNKISLPQNACAFCHYMVFSKTSNSLFLMTSKGLLLRVDAQNAKSDVHSSRKKRKADSDTAGESADQWNVSLEINHRYQITQSMGRGVAGNAVFTSVSRIVLSNDGQWLAVLDALSQITIYNMDSGNVHWTITVARPSVLVTNVAFHPTSCTLLTVLHSNNTFLTYDIEDFCLTPWSKSNSDRFPKDILNLSGSFQDVSFDIKNDQIMFIHGQGFMIHVNIAADIPDSSIVISSTISDGAALIDEKKKTAKDDGRNTNFSTIQTYRSIIHVGALPDQQLVVVENPWVRILESLPDALQRKRYGT